MVVFATDEDVVKRLRRPLTNVEEEYLGGLIEEAQLLVAAYLGCGDDKYPTPEDVPDAVRVVTSRMVARVLQESEVEPAYFGATHIGTSTGPFSEQVTFQAGSRLGSPWLAKSDRETLDPYRCTGKAFSIDTAPGGGVTHSAVCSANHYRGASHWYAYCTCGADIAGHPIYGVDDD